MEIEDKNKKLIIFILLGGMAILIIYLLVNRNKCPECMRPGSECDGVERFKHSKCSEKGLLPILEPEFNFREICKQCILLEDHLYNPRRRCADCVEKHATNMEALGEESVGLDKHKKYGNLGNDIGTRMRDIQRRLVNKDDPQDIAQDLRKLRKELVPLCYDKIPI